MLPIIFKPSKEYELIRLGRNSEGGYLVEKNSILNSTSLILPAFTIFKLFFSHNLPFFLKFN